MTADPSDEIVARLSAADLELTLSQLQGVYASSVLLDGHGAVSKIHVFAGVGRKPKQIVRDIETLLFVKHRVKVDYRKISMIQLPEESLLHMPLARPEIREVKEQVNGNTKTIRVTIQGAGKIVTGQANERIDNPETFRTAARATIEAIEKLLGHALSVRLEDVSTFRFGVREALLVLVTSQIEDREETFIGASLMGARPTESAARATLDALNRRIYNLGMQALRIDSAKKQTRR
jgi:hypothetical protein